MRSTSKVMSTTFAICNGRCGPRCKHTAALGHDAAGQLERGFGFVVREHHVTYRYAALGDDDLIARTWIDSLDEHSSYRRCDIYRPSSRHRLATVRTRWVYIDLREHRLTRIPDTMRSRASVLSAAPSPPWSESP